MKYVNRVIGRDGVGRLYFRKRRHPADGAALTSPWPAIPDGSDLYHEVQTLLNIETVKPRVNNLAGALRRYELEDPRWAVLEASTKAIYHYFIKELMDDIGELPIEAFTSAFLLDLQNAWSARGHRAAEQRMTVLRNVLNPVLISRDLADPFARLPAVPRPRSASEAHRIWPQWVVEAVIGDAIDCRWFGLARAVAIARYTGARRGDLVKLQHTARQVEEGSNSAMTISWITGKRRIQVSQREAPELTTWLASIPDEQPVGRWQAKQQRKNGVFRLKPATLVFNTRNVAFSDNGLGQALASLVCDLHAAGKIDSPDYDLHGLRHTIGVELCLAGATDAQGAAWLGHSSPHSFSTYRRQASRMLLTKTAGHLLSELRKDAGGTQAEQKVQNTVQKTAKRTPIVPQPDR